VKPAGRIPETYNQPLWDPAGKLCLPFAGKARSHHPPHTIPPTPSPTQSSYNAPKTPAPPRLPPAGPLSFTPTVNSPAIARDME